MHVSDVISAMEVIAPPHFAADWDNVGLLVGSSRWPVTKLMLTIDLTAPVLQEAVDASRDMIVAYHPPLFTPVKSFTDEGQLVPLEAARAAVAVYSPHTALDAAPGGINDWLAEGLGSGDVRALEPHEALPETEECKIVTFCPADAVNQLRRAMASAGAGRIGDYELCSFEIKGQGTFLGGEGTRPAVGAPGRLERVDEVRLEMVSPSAALGLLVATLRQFHPYEEPPLEIYPLRARPQRHIGHGRRVVLDQKIDLSALATRIKQVLGVRQVRVAPGRPASRRYRTIGLCAGAGGAMIRAAVRQGCELFITGEMRHHDVLAAMDLGCTVVLAGHTNTERGYLKTLRQRLGHALPELDVSISRKDMDPLRVM